MDEIRVLGTFSPSELADTPIQNEFRKLPFLPACCRTERISIRIPHPLAAPPHPDNLEWHQDGGGAAGTTKHMIIWASETPTNLKTSSGVEVDINPLDVVWFDNTLVFHKQPQGTDEAKRWFVSVRCSGVPIK
jgi:hypothetical protein